MDYLGGSRDVKILKMCLEFYEDSHMIHKIPN